MIPHIADYYGPCDVRAEQGVMRLHCFLRPGAFPASGYVDNRYNVPLFDISGRRVRLCLPGSEPLPVQASTAVLRVDEPIGWEVEQYDRRRSYTEDEFRVLAFGEWREERL